jgi:DNA-binding NarL/FixJ family response regulator
MTESLKFLVVDALEGVQTFARQLLQSYGFAASGIQCCTSTDAALALGLSFKPDFLITDWFAKSPLTGIQLYERLREVQPAMRLSLINFEVTPEHERQAQALKAHFLLRKPFTADQLKAAISRSLEGLAQDAPALHRRVTSVMRAAQPQGGLPRVAMPFIPPQPVIKPGDRVRYNGRAHVAEYVVHRQGGTVVQLKGQPGFIPVDKLQPN